MQKEVRPWGKFEVLFESDRCKVKRLTINPGGKLSLQLHYHRSEHWVNIRGFGLVVVGDTEIPISENHNVFIPKNIKHRLYNPGKVPLEIIETQCGEYLEEDDIVRFDDIYKRK